MRKTVHIFTQILLHSAILIPHKPPYFPETILDLTHGKVSRVTESLLDILTKAHYYTLIHYISTHSLHFHSLTTFSLASLPLFFHFLSIFQLRCFTFLPLMLPPSDNSPLLSTLQPLSIFCSLVFPPLSTYPSLFTVFNFFFTFPLVFDSSAISYLHLFLHFYFYSITIEALQPTPAQAAMAHHLLPERFH